MAHGFEGVGRRRAASLNLFRIQVYERAKSSFEISMHMLVWTRAAVSDAEEFMCSLMAQD
jgi:hypothetical protein